VEETETIGFVFVPPPATRTAGRLPAARVNLYRSISSRVH
jgi:hypothetical protein